MKKRSNDFSWEKANKLIKFAKRKSKKKYFYIFFSISIFFVLVSSFVSVMFFEYKKALNFNNLPEVGILKIPNLDINDLNYNELLYDSNDSLRMDYINYFLNGKDQFEDKFFEINKTFENYLKLFGINSNNTKITIYTDDKHENKLSPEDINYVKYDDYYIYMEPEKNCPIKFYPFLLKEIPKVLFTNMSIFYDDFFAFKNNKINSIDFSKKNLEESKTFNLNYLPDNFSSYLNLKTQKELYKYVDNSLSNFLNNEWQEFKSENPSDSDDYSEIFNIKPIITKSPINIITNTSIDGTDPFKKLQSYFISNIDNVLSPNSDDDVINDGSKSIKLYITYFPEKFSYDEFIGLTSDEDELKKYFNSSNDGTSLSSPIYNLDQIYFDDSIKLKQDEFTYINNDSVENDLLEYNLSLNYEKEIFDISGKYKNDIDSFKNDILDYLYNSLISSIKKSYLEVSGIDDPNTILSNFFGINSSSQLEKYVVFLDKNRKEEYNFDKLSEDNLSEINSLDFSLTSISNEYGSKGDIWSGNINFFTK